MKNPARGGASAVVRAFNDGPTGPNWLHDQGLGCRGCWKWGGERNSMSYWFTAQASNAGVSDVFPMDGLDVSQWPRRGSNPHGDYSPRDFKSRASADFATRPELRFSEQIAAGRMLDMVTPRAIGGKLDFIRHSGFVRICGSLGLLQNTGVQFLFPAFLRANAFPLLFH